MTLESAQKLLMQPDLNTLIGVRDAAILALFIGTGIRLSGLLRLNESALQFYRDEKDKERLAVKVREKGKKERLVPVPDEARLLLRAYLGHPELEAIGRTLPDGDRILFVSTKNRGISEDKYHEERRLSARSVQDMIEGYGKKAGIPRKQLHPHAARHLYGTELAEEKVDLLTRQALLGHADPKSTEIYTQLATRALTRAADKANPLSKIKTPATELAREMARTSRGS